MDKESYIEIKEEFENFEEKLTKHIENSFNSMENEDCYLIEESWSDELIKCFDNCDKYKKNKIDDYSDFLPDEPIFINNFSSVIKYLNSKKRLKVISKKLIDLIYEEEDIKEYKIIKYYSGNNKIIIEFKENYDNKALLIINPLEENITMKNAFIISTKKEERKIIYKEILENNISNIKSKLNIISFEKYINILKLFIHLYYYEKSLLDNKENIFKENENYYLINKQWLDKVKEYYGIANYYKTFNSMKVNGKKINYNNLKKFLNGIINIKNNLILKEDEVLFKEIKKIEEIKTYQKNDSKSKIKYFSNCFIINSEIMYLISNIFNEEMDIKVKKISYKYDNIYIMYLKKILVGNLNENLLFIPKYIISYNSSQIFDSQKQYIFSCPIDEYINSLNCNIYSSKLQILKDENDIELGKLIILSDNNLKNLDSSSDFEYQKKKPSFSTPKKNSIKMKTRNYENYSSEKNLIQSTKNSSNEYVTNNDEYENANFNNKIKNNEIINLNNKLQKYEEIIKELKIEKNKNIEKSIEKEKEYLNKIDSLKKNLLEKEKELKIINNENEQIKEKLKSFENAKKLDKAKITKKEKELQKKIKELEMQNQNLENYENELVQKEEEIENLKNSLKIKEKEILELKNSYQDQINNINENNKKLLDEKNKKVKLNSKYKKENKILKQEKNNMEKEINELKENNNQYINEVKELKLNNKKLKEEIKNFGERENKLIEKENEINKKINFLEEKEDFIEKENIELCNKNKILQKDIIDNKRIKKENEKLIKENNKLINENKELEKTIKKRQKSKKTIPKPDIEPDPIPPSFNFPPLIGLNNIGATCFMNSTLQCLSQTKSLSNYFLKNSNKSKILNNNLALQNPNNYQLSPIYQELIQQLWQKNGIKSFSPSNFMQTIEIMNPLFKQGQAGDSKDFIIYILEQLHKELKKSVKNKNKSQSPLNQYDKNNAFNHFFEEFQQECSIISDVFFGMTETTNECLNCKQNYNKKGINNPICYNYQIFNCLIFPLEEVKNMKNNAFMNNFIQMKQNNIVSLYECFYYNQKSEIFNGQNQNYCNICKRLSDSLYTSRIFVSPNNLVIILNRGKGNIYNVKLNFNEEIDISNFVLQKEKPQILYSLYGVITHIGQSGPNAHFVASCKSPIDNKWYRYNDAIVTPITNVQKEIIDFGTPYILFYQKKN